MLGTGSQLSKHLEAHQYRCSGYVAVRVRVFSLLRHEHS